MKGAGRETPLGMRARKSVDPRRDKVKEYRRACLISCIMRTLDSLSDILVLVMWFYDEEYIIASLLLLFILLPGAFRFIHVDMPTHRNYFVNVLYFIGFSTQLDFVFYFVKKMNPIKSDIELFRYQRFIETILESIPAGTLQLFVLFHTENV
eukprot:UN28158